MHHYKMNMGRLPLSTVWAWGNPVQFLFFVLLYKVLRRTSYSHVLVPGEPGVERLELNRDAVALEATSNELSALGFNVLGEYTTGIAGSSTARARAHLSLDGKVVATASAVTSTATMAQTSVTSSQVSLALWSVAAGGRVIVTSAAMLAMPPVPGIEVIRRRGAAAALLLAAHHPRIAGREARVLSEGDVFDQILEQQVLALRHYERIGLYEPASEEDLARARALASPSAVSHGP